MRRAARSRNVAVPWPALAAAALVVALLQATAASAQETWKTSLDPAAEDVETLDGIIAAFYDVVSGPAGAARNWARDSTLYLPGVRFVVVSSTEDGSPVARNFDHGSWAAGSTESLENGFFEREIHRVTRRFGAIADVFSTYEWRTTEQGPVGGRGVNSLQLFHDGKRWWITGALWANEEPGQPIPPEFLPD
jgi:hypothetical protein